MQTLFAANERWFLNEKGCVGAVDSLAVKPEASRRRLRDCSGARDGTPGPSPEVLIATRGCSPKYASRAPARRVIESFRFFDDFDYEKDSINTRGSGRTNLTRSPSSTCLPHRRRRGAHASILSRTRRASKYGYKRPAGGSLGGGLPEMTTAGLRVN